MNAGAGHLFLVPQSGAALGAMAYDHDSGRAFMRRHESATVALVRREAEDPFRAGNAFASSGVSEDPVTGAAAAAMAGMSHDTGILAARRLTILQGADMGRLSRILVDYAGPAGSPVSVSGASAWNA